MRIFIDDTTDREFNIGEGFTMELSKTNPFLTEEGSQSIPINLPPTDNNLKIIGSIHRGVWTKRPVRRMDVIVQHGAVNLRGVLVIESAHRKEGIDCTFYTHEGQLYETIGETLMDDLEWPEYAAQGGLSGRIMFLKWAMSNPENEDYCIFPVLTSNELKRPDYDREDMRFILNETLFATSSENIEFVGEKERKYIDSSGATITLPVGYGITPFLKVHVILSIIFRNFGYRLQKNIFETIFPRLCLVNNTADAICKDGMIYYKQLIPENLKVIDFLTILRRKFGIEFIPAGKNVAVKSWDDTLIASPDKDFSLFTDKDIHPYFVDASNLEITMDRSLTPYANVETNSREELENKYKDHKSLLFYLPSYGQYTLFRLGIENTYISSAFFDKNADHAINVETIDPGDVSVPVTYAPLTMPIGGSGALTIPVSYIGGLRNINTAISMNDNSEPGKEEEYNLNVMFCYEQPGFVTIYGPIRDNIIKMGTCFNWKQGNSSKWTSLNITYTGEDNLYDYFYKRRDDMLKYANQEVVFYADILPEEIFTMDVTTPKIVNGIKILIERIDYVLGAKELCKITARTLHEFPE